MSDGPAIIIPEETEIDIYVTGTCTVAPGESYAQVMKELQDGSRARSTMYWGKKARGTGTVAAVKGPKGSFFVGLGDFADYDVMSKSVGTFGYPADLKGSIALHTHPDHIMFSRLKTIGQFPVYISEDDFLLPIVLDPKGNEKHVIDGALFDAYAQHRKQGMKPSDFKRINPDYHGIEWLPKNARLFATPGHDKSCMSLHIDGPVTVRSFETGKAVKSRYGAVIEEDNLCDSRYIFQAMNRSATSVYDMSAFSPRTDDPTQDIASHEKILEAAGEYGVIIPGHGEPCIPHYIKDGLNFKTTYKTDFRKLGL